MKKCLSLLLAALMLAAVLTGCGGNPSTEETDAPADTGTEQAAQTNWNVSSVTGTGTELKFRTGGDQGTYYGFGSVLAQAITTNGNGTKVTAVVSNGSQDNIEQMQMNVAQLGFVQSDVMSYAYNGERLFEGFPYADFSTVAALAEQVQIVTCDPDIKSVADLEGKTVSIGASGSGVYYNALDILAAYDLTEDDINAQYQDFGASADALQDGKIDAAFVVAGAPTVAITTLATAKDTYLVGLDDEHIAKLQESSPYYEEYIIPEGTYEGVPETKTVAVVATVIARDDVSEDDVYNICYTIFENMDNLAHDKAGELDVEFASGVTAVPYHAGAAKYFAEKGFDVPTHDLRRSLTGNYGGNLRRSSLTSGRSGLEDILRNERGPVALFKKHKTEPVPPEDTGAHDTLCGDRRRWEAVMKIRPGVQHPVLGGSAEGDPLAGWWRSPPTASSTLCSFPPGRGSGRPCSVGLILLFGFLTFRPKKGTSGSTTCPGMTSCC